jgi:DNA-binding MarR family transcriptional regulator
MKPPPNYVQAVKTLTHHGKKRPRRSCVGGGRLQGGVESESACWHHRDVGIAEDGTRLPTYGPLTSADARNIAPAVERLLVELARRRFGEMEPSPLTTTQQLALTIVVDDGPMRLRELAQRVGTTPATGTRSVDALEAHGFVRRQTDPYDGRGVVVSATHKGQEARRETHAQLVILLERRLDQLEPEARDRFITLMSDLDDLVAASRHPR